MIVNSGLEYEKVDIGAEPVDLDALKSYLMVDYDDQNTLIESLGVAARKHIEDYLAISLVDSTVTAYWKTLCSCELPFGPVKEIISSTDGVDDITDDVSFSGFKYKVISADRSDPTQVVYNTGWENGVPEDLKLAIKKLVVDNFEQRSKYSLGGNITFQTYDNDWKETCKRYSRKNFLQ